MYPEQILEKGGHRLRARNVFDTGQNYWHGHLYYGYWACSVSRSAIMEFECNLGLVGPQIYRGELSRLETPVLFHVC